MAQVINTNIPSLNAQGNLNKTSAKYNQSLQRLSSGLRINSAKDDAAGLAIATRMQSTISGLTTARRNANDAISLAQIAEGALQESTQILQRARELAVQSANGTNAVTDRASLQSEVNQLKSELSRISTKTTFNGLNLLDGSLAAAEFQIGPNQNETVTVSISDARNIALGSNDLDVNSTDGILNANYANTFQLLGTGVTTIENNAGAAVVTNGISANDLSLTPLNTDGLTNGTAVTVPVLINEPASLIAANISAAVDANGNNVASASARTGTRLTVTAWENTGNASIAVKFKDTASYNVAVETIADNTDVSDIAIAINSNTVFQSEGVYAVAGSGYVDIFSNTGHDLGFAVTDTGNTNTVSFTRLDNGGAVSGNATTLNDINATNSVNITGIVTASVYQNYTLTDAGTDLIQANAQVNTAIPTGLIDSSQKNRMEAQTLTIAGSRGSSTLSIDKDATALTVKRAVNNLTSSTGVGAMAQTTLNIQDISSGGTVSFQLKGDNKLTPATINANISTSDYSQLVKAINDVVGTTGITAKFDGADDKVRLTNLNGEDIEIYDFSHSDAVDAPKTEDGILDGNNGSLYNAQREQTMTIIGNPDDNTGGTSVKLYAGADKTDLDSTVVGGKITFTSDRGFSLSSNISGNNYSGSIFSDAVNTSFGSSFSSIDSLDISSSQGAQEAIRILDQALTQVSEVRAELGAVQSRFESTIRNLTNNVENLSAAKSRVEDADFAAETAELSKTQMLTQAGLSILSQANAIPQSILTLLQ